MQPALGVVRAGRKLIVVACGVAVALPLSAARSPQADRQDAHRIDQFLQRATPPQQYRAMRRLEADTRGQSVRGWLEAWTELSPGSGFRYQIVAEGGSGDIRSRVLRAVLDKERQLIERGEAGRAAFEAANYEFQPAGLDETGLLKVAIAARRREGLLVNGAIFLRPTDGELMRVEGELAKNPSFWVKKVTVVRNYQRINGVLLPVTLESTAQVRLFGPSRFRMTYDYVLVDGRPVRSHP